MLNLLDFEYVCEFFLAPSIAEVFEYAKSVT